MLYVQTTRNLIIGHRWKPFNHLTPMEEKVSSETSSKTRLMEIVKAEASKMDTMQNKMEKPFTNVGEEVDYYFDIIDPHRSIKPLDKDIVEANKVGVSMLYGEVLSTGVSRVCSPDCLNASNASVVVDLGAGRAKIPLQMLLQYPNIKKAVAVEFSRQRFVTTLKAMCLLSMKQGYQLEFTEDFNKPGSLDQLYEAHVSQCSSAYLHVTDTPKIPSGMISKDKSELKCGMNCSKESQEPKEPHSDASTKSNVSTVPNKVVLKKHKKPRKRTKRRKLVAQKRVEEKVPLEVRMFESHHRDFCNMDDFVLQSVKDADIVICEFSFMFLLCLDSSRLSFFLGM